MDVWRYFEDTSRNQWRVCERCNRVQFLFGGRWESALGFHDARHFLEQLPYNGLSEVKPGTERAH
jgi:hypothetical protein